MEFLKEALDFVLHLDRHLGPIIQEYGLWTYLILFAVIFCETGLVVTPFLPGDSLLFLAGVFAGRGELSLLVLIASLTAAAIIGDTVNYWVGHFLGHRLLTARRRIIKPEHLAYTHEFFEKYGGKTIILARFVPIVRTLAPFVAGLGSMTYGRFMTYNVVGGAGWVLICTLAGYALYSNQFVQDHFFVVEVIIIALSLLPAAWELWRARRAGRRRGGTSPSTGNAQSTGIAESTGNVENRGVPPSESSPPVPLTRTGEGGEDGAEEKALLVPLAPLGREGPGE